MAKKGTFIGIALVTAAILLGSKEAIAAGMKVQNLEKNLIVKNTFDSVYGPAKDTSGKLTGDLRIYVRTNIYNYSGFDLKVQKVFVTLESSEDGKTWTRVGFSPNRYEEVNLQDGKPVTAKIPIDLSPSILTALQNTKVLFQVRVAYEWKGLQQNEYSVFEVTSIRNNLIGSLKKAFGLGGVVDGQQQPGKGMTLVL